MENQNKKTKTHTFNQNVTTETSGNFWKLLENLTLFLSKAFSCVRPKRSYLFSDLWLLQRQLSLIKNVQILSYLPYALCITVFFYYVTPYISVHSICQLMLSCVAVAINLKTGMRLVAIYNVQNIRLDLFSEVLLNRKLSS